MPHGETETASDTTNADVASEPLYSPEQIAIPENLPFILKKYSKAVIRAQPQDLYSFSKDYFVALDDQKKNEEPVGSALTVDHLKQLHEELAKRKLIPNIGIRELEQCTAECGFQYKDVETVLSTLKVETHVDYQIFIAICSSLLAKDLFTAMSLCFKVFDWNNPETGKQAGEGVEANILLKIWEAFVSRDNNVKEDVRTSLVQFLTERESGLVTFDEFQSIFERETKSKENT